MLRYSVPPSEHNIRESPLLQIAAESPSSESSHKDSSHLKFYTNVTGHDEYYYATSIQIRHVSAGINTFSSDISGFNCKRSDELLIRCAAFSPPNFFAPESGFRKQTLNSALPCN
ncbi:hypothetical protein NPIL_341841 [Nephila pilipes]|uniref:Uncharacterized protein n=1 Tax=Nephila pilipes TaxID=299642 RepID=A0A8X6PWS2_NEPPI|nr:hypothetical protein NPIL_341841 [Nephila pilipes]